jgi:hypothetical protein
MHRFKWLFQDERSSAGGRGIARIAGPDSLRFDVAGPLGAGKASAVVIGDSARWVDADKSILDLVPNYPLLWAMLGVARPPGPDSELRGLEDENKVSWLYANGADTVEYRRLAGNPMRLQAEARHAGKVVGRTEISFSADGVPLKARLLVPRVPAKLDLTFYASTRNPEFAPDLWLPRQH